MRRVPYFATVRASKPLRGGPNVKIVAMAMEEDGLRGDPRNFVILTGAGDLLTHLKRYKVELKGTDEPVDVRVPDGSLDVKRERSVVHRRHLWRYLGPEVARTFWRLGARTRS